MDNFADGNTSAVTCKNLNDLLHTLEKESESAVDWFKNINMIANPDKFQAIITNKGRENQITHNLKLYNNEIGTAKSVNLLGIDYDKFQSTKVIRNGKIVWKVVLIEYYLRLKLNSRTK